jgi:hypothetical protein
MKNMNIKKKKSPVRTVIGLIALAGALGGLIYVLNNKPRSLEEDFAQLNFVSNGQKLEQLDAKAGDRIYVYAHAENKQGIDTRSIYVNGQNAHQGLSSQQYKSGGKTIVETDDEGSPITTSRPEFRDGSNSIEYVITGYDNQETRSKPIILNLTK